MNKELPFFTISLQASAIYNLANYLELSFCKTIISPQIFCYTFAPGLSKYKDIQLFPLLNQLSATQNNPGNWTSSWQKDKSLQPREKGDECMLQGITKEITL